MRSEPTANGRRVPRLFRSSPLGLPLLSPLPMLARLMVGVTLLGSCASGEVADLTLASQELKTQQSTVTFLKPAADDPDCIDAKESYSPASADFKGFGVDPVETQSPSLDAIRERGFLIAGVDQDTYLFGYRSPQSKQIEGFDIDVLKAVAKRIFNSDDPKHLRLKAI